MHVAPEGLKTVRQDGITVRFAMLGPMAYVLAEVPRPDRPGRHSSSRATARTGASSSTAS